MGLIENRFDPNILFRVYAERSEASPVAGAEFPRFARDKVVGSVLTWV